MKKIHWLALIAAVLISQLAGIIGSVFTFQSIPTWYAGIQKPDFNPPSWVFGPVWTTLYTLMGIAAYLVWEKGIKKKGVKQALVVFGVQLILNAIWSILFFGMQNPFLAFIEIIFLWISIVATIFLFYKISKTAGYLLVPYILWVSFAAILNFYIWQLNF
jgi:benzodiazapine receptor